MLMHGFIIEKDWQIMSFKKYLWFGKYVHSLGRNQETTWFRVSNLILVERLIQIAPLNHYMRFNLNDLKVLHH